MTFSLKKQAIWAAIEDTYNVLKVPVATDAIKVSNLQVNRAADLRLIERQNIKETFGSDQAVVGGSLMEFGFDVEVKGSGTAGVAPRLGRLLLGCGMSETIVAATSVTYEPSSDVDNHDSLTIFYKEGPNLRKVTGCRGNASFKLPAGDKGLISFTFKGHIASEAVEAAPLATHETTKPPPFKSAAFSVGGFETAIESLAIDLANSFAAGPDPNSDDSYGQVIITDREPAGSFNPEAQSISVKDYIAEFRASTAQAIATGVVGAVAGNRWAFAIPAAYYREIGQGDRNSLLTFDISIGCAEVDGDDQFSAQFT